VIPDSHRDLLERPLPAVLANHLSTGRLQVSVVWVTPDGDDVVLSTMAEFAKARHLRERPRATLLLRDADGRWLELRADVTHDPDERPGAALAVLDAIAVRYTGMAPHFGAVVPAELAEVEHPVTFRLRPVQVAAGTAPHAPLPLDVAGAPVAPLPPDAVPLPATHLDLLDGRTPAVVATVRPDGRARTRPVACGTDGAALLVAADDEVLADLAADARATALVVDPADSGRWLQVRGDAEATRAPGATDAVVRLVPRRIVCDAIH
jgi:PPOX class probable F420-dependent enzyme